MSSSVSRRRDLKRLLFGRADLIRLQGLYGGQGNRKKLVLFRDSLFFSTCKVF